LTRKLEFADDPHHTIAVSPSATVGHILLTSKSSKSILKVSKGQVAIWTRSTSDLPIYRLNEEREPHGRLAAAIYHGEVAIVTITSIESGQFSSTQLVAVYKIR
jgi:hypothetical protein